MKPGDIIKIKLGGDVHEAKVLDCRNKKTIWVEVLWSKTRIHALTPAEKKKVAESPISLEGLSENEKALAVLAQAGKKVVHQKGTKRIKIPRVRVIDAEPFEPQVKQPKVAKPFKDSAVEIFNAEYTVQPMETAEDSTQTSSIEREEQEAIEPRQSSDLEFYGEYGWTNPKMEKPLSKLEQMKARIAAKKGEENV